jgi:nicotinamidase-related amidase
VARAPRVWIRNVYNTETNWCLSKVWLEQVMCRRRGRSVDGAMGHGGAWGGDFFQVKPRPDAVIVTKHRYGAFEGADLDLVLRSHRICSVIMAGVATNVSVEPTAWAAGMPRCRPRAEGGRA